MKYHLEMDLADCDGGVHHVVADLDVWRREVTASVDGGPPSTVPVPTGIPREVEEE